MATELIAGDASNESQLVGGNDGTLVVRTGLAGSKVTAVSIGTDGKPSFPLSATFQTAPTITTAQSMVRVNTGNGHGSTNTKIRRFSNVVTNQGADITYADSATLGGSFTVNTNGVYAISYTDSTTSSIFGLSLNTTQPTTDIHSLTNKVEALGMVETGTNNWEAVVSWTGYLAAGSVVRAHTRGGAQSLDLAQLTIVKVA